MISRKAKTYGSSLYDLAAEEGLEDRILSDMQALSSAARDIPGYVRLLSSPAVPLEERKGLVREAWEGSIHPYSLNFACLLLDHGMADELCQCAEEYKNRYDDAHGILQVTAVSAVPLSSEERERLVRAIETRTGKKAELTEKTDSSLIGGMRLEMDGKAYEGSVSSHLDALRRLLEDNR
ncbi:MAG: ATP synthase F1 subunit delta [Firmicutes bacterium]|nr:ATP synthase F1 subunit delta [Bacillota bacterium]MBQ3579050.1 ATP synthase F1 subunit delta [Bacillota bacterium]MBR0441982.1 ATP synthase F1 subunit delta [Bacillota bacterium]MBR0523202.1 ATP synthase F1 subunit delta [Bacillota bacterium]